MIKKNYFSKIISILSVMAVLFWGVNVVFTQNSQIIESIPRDNIEENIKNIEVQAEAPKYVFYFIGDGLASSQRQLAEYFLKEKLDDNMARLTMNKLSVVGMNSTHSSNSLVTDSAASATSLATGFKTNGGMVAQLPDGTPVRTIVQAARDAGMGTGVISNMRITHATPASFVAHNESRNNENEMAIDYVNSNIDFFAGGGYRHFVPKGFPGSRRKDDRNLVEEFKNKGYNVFLTENDTNAFRNFNPSKKERVFALLRPSEFAYEKDRDDTKEPSLAELTQKGIDVLKHYEKGFFMTVEGGKIDYAGHANDPIGMIYDILAFDEAISVAYEFYKENPEETLIVVVGDHETGGLGLGFRNDYFMDMSALTSITGSIDMVSYNGNREEFLRFLEEEHGLTNLTTEEIKKLQKAMDMVDNGDRLGYMPSYMTPATAAVSEIISARANIFWTTYAHTGTTVPLSTEGIGSERFGGYKDNTEVALTFFELMGFEPGKVE